MCPARREPNVPCQSVSRVHTRQSFDAKTMALDDLEEPRLRAKNSDLLKINCQLSAQYKRVSDCAASARFDYILYVGRNREPAIEGDLVIYFNHRLGACAWNVTAERPVDHSRCSHIVVASGQWALIAQATTHEVRHGVDSCFRREGGL